MQSINNLRLTIKTMYKVIQNYNQSNEYEYVHDYKTIADAQKTIREYRQEDIKDGSYHDYTIVDNDYNDINETMSETFTLQATQAMIDIGLTEDEALRQLEDILA